jgi:tRNA(Ile)-lysidine synthase
MKVSVRPGKYVVAVSGGVDSMVLLDVLSKEPSLDLVVAHFEHGIREDSDIDRQLVEAAAQKYGLPFRFERGNLGAGASEAAAREARYVFLRRIQQETGAAAIITAHHQDDLVETAIINLIRGTGRKGLSSLASTDTMLRPFLQLRKQDIYQQAEEISTHDPAFAWHDDSTNGSDQYLRNYIRHYVTGKLDEAKRAQLLSYIEKAAEANPLIDQLLLQDMDNSQQQDELQRQWFIMLPYDVSCEVMAAWLRQNGIRQFDRKVIERLVVAAKVALPGKLADIGAGYYLKTEKTVVRITPGTLS